MVNIQIPDDLDAELQLAADRLGRTKDDLVHEALCARLDEEFASETNFTEEQIARFRHSIAQLDRGEIVTAEEVDSFFVDLRKRLAAR